MLIMKKYEELSPLWEDTLEVARHLRRAYPHAKLVIMGWHLGRRLDSDDPGPIDGERKTIVSLGI